MIKKTMLLGALLSTVIFTLGPTEIFADNTGIVTAYKLNVRSGPSTKYSVVGSLSKNKEVTILSSSQGWHKVRLSNNKEGWTSGKYIKTSQESNLNNNSNTVSNTTNKAGVVTTYKLNVRSGPSTKYGVVGSLSKNKIVKILSSSQGWHKVRLSNNKEGWASGKYIKTSQDLNSNSNSDNSNNNGINNNSPNQDKKTISVEASAYTGYSTTSTGQKPVWGTIAVDPKVIPYGTKIYIPYFNKVFVANDCGGAIKGNKIDIFMNTRSQCYDWGRRTIEIQILGK
ncbi:SH3 domain-containing protein [Romboutsia sp.]|uniref:SH3 domain-containing protein n=1 Tax=Romboutsia sp. TaxID=1965302 RepID=UPI002BBDBB2F|nr:SH3 domain-containing protein [Romboutsia sp.]HSQ87397.1 SH3 domain-containing protein [Romboutsia sp.]